MTQAVSPSAADLPGAGLWRWIGFAAMCGGMFMAVLDIQVVVTSLSVIETALKIGAERMSWVQTAYLIAEIIAIPLTGLLIRILTMRILFAGATLAFTLASIACALSFDFGSLIAARIVQGFAGGVLIPLVFAAVFLLFAERQRALATTLAGIVAVLAPTLGPIVGGWLTETASWHWLFLVNVVPGLVAAALGARHLPREVPRLNALRQFDFLSLTYLALALGALEIAIKDAPHDGWSSAWVLSLLAITITGGTAFIQRALAGPAPLVDITLLRDRHFAAACALSFALGAAMFGMVYLIPVFLAFVRGYGPLRIGEIMLVTGAAQLVMAPFAAQIEKRIDARLVTAAGFVLFATGLWLSAGDTRDTDYDGMFWPQVLRGAAMMLCLLAPTRIALGHLTPERIGDGSSLFNMMRNLGGAIGIALVDTVIFSRAPEHAEALMDKIRSGDAETLALVGLTPADIAGDPDPMTLMSIAPDIEQLSLVLAINEAWMLLAAVAVAGLAALVFTRGLPAPFRREESRPG
ncbi:MDR family MFS transporter [soil metagenome]